VVLVDRWSHQTMKISILREVVEFGAVPKYRMYENERYVANPDGFKFFVDEQYFKIRNTVGGPINEPLDKYTFYFDSKGSK
jgi:hypothetical protein